MGFECDVCGCVYEWEMFYNNHRRDVHAIKTKRNTKTMRLSRNDLDFLEGYFNSKCRNPSLEEIKLLATLMDLKKEKVYWWFVNRNKKYNASLRNKSGSSDKKL